MAANKVDMSLDDIIKTTKIGKGGRRGRGSSNKAQTTARGGVQRNGFYNVNTRRGVGRGIRRNMGQRRGQPQRFIPRGNVDGVWTHDLFQGRPLRTITEGKLLISNLDFGVSESDIKELFSEFGQLRKSAVHFDFSGRSLGTAEVIFTSKQDAIKAMNRYNSVPLDGRPMNIQIVENTPSIQTRVTRVPTRGRTFASPRFLGGYTNSRGSRGFVRGSYRGGNRGANTRGRRGGGGGRGGVRQSAVTKEELDAQLDNYNKMDTE